MQNSHNPTEQEVIDLVSKLPFVVHYGKDRDGVLELQIPICDETHKTQWEYEVHDLVLVRRNKKTGILDHDGEMLRKFSHSSDGFSDFWQMEMEMVNGEDETGSRLRDDITEIDKGA
jgi:hypothetical protein